MAKTACEEAADFLSDDYGIVGISARKKITAHPDVREALAKRLRAEGRELKQYRRLLSELCCGVDSKEREAANKLHDLSDRIQKARTKK
jgi:hypothetical protein